jgi:RNA polymerase sigma-70 factor (ECF subfamily)
MDSDSFQEHAVAGPDEDASSVHLRRAVGGDMKSLSWIVSRFSPLLLAQAEYRLGPRLRQIHDPEDLVSEVWMVTLPRLRGLAPRSGRFTPILVKFLSSVLLHRVNRLVRRHLNTENEELPKRSESDSDRFDAVPDSTIGVVTSVVRKEVQSLLLRSLRELEPADQAVIILRSIEQRPCDQVARLLQISPGAVYVRHHRALERLRKHLPESLVSELEG